MGLQNDFRVQTDVWLQKIDFKWLTKQKTYADLIQKNHSTQDSRVVPHRGTN